MKPFNKLFTILFVSGAVCLASTKGLETNAVYVPRDEVAIEEPAPEVTFTETSSTPTYLSDRELYDRCMRRLNTEVYCLPPEPYPVDEDPYYTRQHTLGIGPNGETMNCVTYKGLTDCI